MAIEERVGASTGPHAGPDTSGPDTSSPDTSGRYAHQVGVGAAGPGQADAHLGGPATEAGSTFRGVVRSREFRWLWLGGAQSMLGDQLARVALTILVYDRTSSPLATAGVYALTFLPALAGNLALGPVADRLPPRFVLVGGDLVRAALLAAMALPHLPIAAVTVLLTLAVFIGAPWKSAETALVADLVAEHDYALGLGLRTATMQAAQLVGFAIGGLAVGLLGARTALAVDAATFAVSAAAIRVGVRARPAADPDATADDDHAAAEHADTDTDHAAADGHADDHAADDHAADDHAPDRPESRGWFGVVVAVLRVRRLRILLGFSWLLGLLVVPEGLAAPFAHLRHAGPSAVGLLLAAGPTGVLIGSVIFSRWVPGPTRARLLGPLAIASGLALVVSAFTPGLAATLALWALSGAATAYHVEVIAEYVKALRPGRRVQGLGVASAALLGAQGIGLLAGGALCQWAGPAVAVGAAGACASAVAVFLTLARNRS